MNRRETWEDEYTEHDAIPSSHRPEPSRALRALLAVTDTGDEMDVLDVGCGNGRNTVHLAAQGHHVTALDFSDTALELAQKRVRAEALDDHVEFRNTDVQEGLDLEDDSIDLVTDAYVSCHFLTPAEQDRYWHEIERVLRDDGHVLWIGMSVDDGYYSTLSPSHPQREVVVDPLNDVAKRLYSQADLASMTPETLTITTTMDLAFTDTVDEEEYMRHVLGAVYHHD